MNSSRAVLVAAVAFAALYSVASASPCRPDQVSLRHRGTVASFTVEVADTNELRSSGLMFREDLPRFSGMLFIYDTPQTVHFWMKNTPLSLDLLFVDEVGVITRIRREAVPFSEQTIIGGTDVLMVLEVNGGTVDRLGLSEGAEMQHPELDQSIAIWPCGPN